VSLLVLDSVGCDSSAVKSCIILSFGNSVGLVMVVVVLVMVILPVVMGSGLISTADSGSVSSGLASSDFMLSS